MDDDAKGIPAGSVIIDQVVALNMRYWRRQARMTQEELGKKLGWSAANVSAAERSADWDRDRRRFDAQTLADLSLALGVPLIALLLPPEDDGTGTRYTFRGPGGEHDMETLMRLVVMTDNDDEGPVMQSYRQRLRTAAGRYLDPGWQKEVGAWLQPMEPPEVRAERADRLRSLAQAHEHGAAELWSLADAIDPAKEEE